MGLQMLVLTRKLGEILVIGDDIKITVNSNLQPSCQFVSFVVTTVLQKR